VITAGTFRRAIDLKRCDHNCVVAWLEDDVHHLGVTIDHDQHNVIRVSAKALRVPWSTCPEATAGLQQLTGKPLFNRASDIGLYLNMRSQCTHLFDLAGLAVAHAASGRESRRYDVVVPVPTVRAWDHGRCLLEQGRAELLRDGKLVFHWIFEDLQIVGPDQFAGLSLQEGFRAWTEGMPVDEAEAATVLRRALTLVGARRYDQHLQSPMDLPHMTGSCYTYQSAVAKGARFVRILRDFSDTPDAMLRESGKCP